MTSLPTRRDGALGLVSLLIWADVPPFSGCGQGAETMAALTDVQRLQSRVEELERWVYGPGGTRGSRKVRGSVY